MKMMIALVRSLVGQIHMHLAEVPCATPVQVNLPYGDERRGDCRDRRAARVAELRKTSDFGLDARTVDIEICDRCKALDGVSHAIETLQHIALKEWPAEWPEWRNKK